MIKSCPSASLGLPSIGSVITFDKFRCFRFCPHQVLWQAPATKASLSVPSLGIDLVVEVHAGGQTTVQLTGPADRWWGIAFGATTMAEMPYALIFESAGNGVTERRLGAYNEGRRLDSSATTIDSHESPTDRFKRVRAFMRPSSSEKLGSDYFDFAKGIRAGEAIDVMVAVGSESGVSDLKYHSSMNRHALSLMPEFEEDPSAFAGVTSGGVRRNAWTSWYALVLATLCLSYFVYDIPSASAHNWINNPKSRIVGLSKTAPCPPRPGKSINFAVREGASFPLEWATGHPGTYTYFAIVARENEDKLSLHTEALFNDYLASAPAGHSFLKGSFYDKTHMRWTGTAMPKPGGSDGGIKYAKRLAEGDVGYFKRPADWRVSRKCKGNSCDGKVFAQYSYLPEYTKTDQRAAYQSHEVSMVACSTESRAPKPRTTTWLGAMPSFAKPGEHVIQYLWRGYYDCFGVALVKGTRCPNRLVARVAVREGTDVHRLRARERGRMGGAITRYPRDFWQGKVSVASSQRAGHLCVDNCNKQVVALQ